MSFLFTLAKSVYSDQNKMNEGMKEGINELIDELIN